MKKRMFKVISFVIVSLFISNTITSGYSSYYDQNYIKPDIDKAEDWQDANQVTVKEVSYQDQNTGSAQGGNSDSIVDKYVKDVNALVTNAGWSESQVTAYLANEGISSFDIQLILQKSTTDYIKVDPNQDQQYVPGQLIVGFNDGVSMDVIKAIIEAAGGEILEAYDSINAVLIKFDGDMQDMIDKLQANEAVKYAEPNHILHTMNNPNQNTQPQVNEPVGLSEQVGSQVESGGQLIDIINNLITNGVDLGNIITALLYLDYSVEDIASILKEAGVSAEDAVKGFQQARTYYHMPVPQIYPGSEDISNPLSDSAIAKAMLDGGYSVQELVDGFVAVFKDLGQKIYADGPDGGSETDLTMTDENIIRNVYDILTGAGVDGTEVKQALLSHFSQEQIDTALNSQLDVPGIMDKINKQLAAGAELKDIVKNLITNGADLGNVVSALLNLDNSAEDIAGILKGAGVSAEDAIRGFQQARSYDYYANFDDPTTNRAPYIRWISNTEIAKAMLDGGYSVQEVVDGFVAVFKDLGQKIYADGPDGGSETDLTMTDENIIRNVYDILTGAGIDGTEVKQALLSHFTQEQIDTALGKGEFPEQGPPVSSNPNYLGSINVNGIQFAFYKDKTIWASDGTQFGTYEWNQAGDLVVKDIDGNKICVFKGGKVYDAKGNYFAKYDEKGNVYDMNGKMIASYTINSFLPGTAPATDAKYVANIHLSGTQFEFYDDGTIWSNGQQFGTYEWTEDGTVLILKDMNGEKIFKLQNNKVFDATGAKIATYDDKGNFYDLQGNVFATYYNIFKTQNNKENKLVYQGILNMNGTKYYFDDNNKIYDLDGNAVYTYKVDDAGKITGIYNLDGETQVAEVKNGVIFDMDGQRIGYLIDPQNIDGGTQIKDIMTDVLKQIGEGKQLGEIVKALVDSGKQAEHIVSALLYMDYSMDEIVSSLKEAGLTATEVVQAFAKSEPAGSWWGWMEPRRGYTDSDQYYGGERFSHHSPRSWRGWITPYNYRNFGQQVDLASSMLDAGYTAEEVAQGFVDNAQGSEESRYDQQMQTINLVFDILTSAGVDFGETLDALESCGFSQGQIARALSRGYHMPWGWFRHMFGGGRNNREVQEIIDTIITQLGTPTETEQEPPVDGTDPNLPEQTTPATQLVDIVKSLIDDGKKPQNIVSALLYLDYSASEIVDTLKSAGLETKDIEKAFSRALHYKGWAHSPFWGRDNRETRKLMKDIIGQIADGQDVVNIVKSFIDAGKKPENIVRALINLDYSRDEITDTLKGAGLSAEEIVQAFQNAGSGNKWQSRWWNWWGWRYDPRPHMPIFDRPFGLMQSMLNAGFTEEEVQNAFLANGTYSKEYIGSMLDEIIRRNTQSTPI